MLLNDGNESLFWIDSISCGNQNRVYLTHVENDSHGMKMTGDIPSLWKHVNHCLLGPDLYDDDHNYRVVNVDYSDHYIWLEEI